MRGQIIPRGANVWRIRIPLGRNEAGTRVYHSMTLHGTKDDAERKHSALLRDFYEGKLSIGSESLFISALIDDVLRDYRIDKQDVATAEHRAKKIRPAFGHLTPSKIRPSHVESYIDAAIAKGTPNSTINRELSLLRRSFTLAVRNGKIRSIPFNIRKLKEDNTRKGFFEHEQYKAMLAALPVEYRPVLTFAYWTGCRKGEILSLQWRQVDLLSREVRLDPGTTKNEEPRIIPLGGELLQTLSMQRSIRHMEHPDSPWVFFHLDGRRIKDFRKSWQNAARQAGLWNPATDKADKLFHDLRRTGVRNLVRAGVPEKIAMLISGHKTRSVFERYNVTDTRDLHDAMRKLNAYTQAREEQARDREPASREQEQAPQQQAMHPSGTQSRKSS